MPRKAKSPDRFRVGQRVRLVLGPESGWSEYNNEPAVVVGPKVYGSWRCQDSRGRGEAGTETGYRYAVRFSVGVRNLCEQHMRPLDDDANDVTTWAAFKKATGFRLDRPPVTTKRQRKTTGTETSHG